MSPDRRLTLLLLPLLLGFGALSWSLQLREGPEVDAGSLERIPSELGGWEGHTLPMESEVEEMLDADYNLMRAYVREPFGLIWLYVGYYGTSRGGRPEHTPWICYPSAGWTIEREEVVRLPGKGGGRANEIVVAQAGERRLVHFWYQSHRKTGMLGGLEQSLDHLMGRLESGRADGSLVRLSTPIAEDGDEGVARSRLTSFARNLGEHLQTTWPNETSDP